MNAPLNKVIKKPAVGVVQLENLPQEFATVNRYIRWGYTQDTRDPGKFRKSPLNAEGARCGYSDKSAWLSLKDAVHASGSTGIGIGMSLGKEGLLLSDGDREGYVYCLDFDGFSDNEGKQVDKGVLEIMALLPTYCELSPSGTGFKVFLLTDMKPTTKSKYKFGPSKFAKDHPDIRKYQHREIEVFSKGFFMAVTGETFNSDHGKLSFIPAVDLEKVFDEFHGWAMETGGIGREQASPSPATNTDLTEYSKLVPDSLEYALAYIDHNDEQYWSDVANTLARAYGEDGRQFFISFSRGDYTNTVRKGFNLGEVNARFDRALRELDSHPKGYGVMHLVSLASSHPEWPHPALEYEDEISQILNAPATPVSKDNKIFKSTSAYTKKMSSGKNTINLSDVTNGERFAQMHRGKLLFVSGNNKWLKFSNKKGWGYTKPRGEDKAAKKTLKSMRNEAAKALRKNPEAVHTRKLVTEVSRASRATNLRAMIEMAKSEEGMQVELSSLDADDWLLGITNGVLNLKTGKQLEIGPDLLVTKRCNVVFDPSAKCPRFEQFLGEVVPDIDERKFLLRWLGYLLTGCVTEQKLMFVQGPGCNGKSVLMELMAWLLGDYARKIQTEMLMRQYRSVQSASPDLVSLQGRRFVYCNETTDGQWLDDARIKELTGGDTITGRIPYAAEAVEFPPTHKLIIAGNHAPMVSDDGHGLWRRMMLFPFGETIDKKNIDPNLLEKLKTEGPGILNLLLTGLTDWRKRGLQLPKTLKSATKKYRSEQDLIGDWLADRCKFAPGLTAQKKVLYANYRDWCTENGCVSLSKNRFSRKLTGRGHPTAKDNRTVRGLSTKGYNED